MQTRELIRVKIYAFSIKSHSCFNVKNLSIHIYHNIDIYIYCAPNLYNKQTEYIYSSNETRNLNGQKRKKNCLVKF